jgi:hypothetical protein
MLTTFRINTCKSVSKQRTLTPFRINTYKKQGGMPCQSRRIGTRVFSRMAHLLARSRDQAYLGAGAVDEGAGWPSMVFGSMSSMRVPSGSNTFTWRFLLTPTLISMDLV